MRREIAYLILLASGGAIACAPAATQADPETPRAQPAGDMAFSYNPYERLLAEHVNEQGQVDYAALKAGRGPLDEFVAAMGAVSPTELASWSEDEQLAFWINAYNAITLLYIVDRYPIEKGGLLARAMYPANSIRQIAGVWDTLETPVAGTPMTLDHIEHEILRKDFTEPRIHMAIVCASIGCPPIRDEPFTAEKLEQQLDDQSRRFLSDPDKFRIDRNENVVYLSPIFDWFGKDFVPVYGDGRETIAGQDKTESAVLRFVSQYVSESDRNYLVQGGYTVKYSDYDWSLNDQ